jgi:hypothetical protein
VRLHISLSLFDTCRVALDNLFYYGDRGLSAADRTRLVAMLLGQQGQEDAKG